MSAFQNSDLSPGGQGGLMSTIAYREVQQSIVTIFYIIDLWERFETTCHVKFVGKCLSKGIIVSLFNY